VVRFHTAKLLLVAGLVTSALAAAARAGAAVEPPGLSWGGSVAVTSDYIYRGVSQSNGRPAVQADVHAGTEGGTFAGAWASSRDSSLEPGARGELEIYLGRRIDLTGSWQATLSVRGRYYVGGTQDASDDYQELGGALTWLDRATFSMSVIPSAVRYWYSTRLPRSPAWVVDAAGQWLVASSWFVTGGAGYYRSTGTGPGIEAATGYAYGNAGLAYEARRWRLDIGYFLAENQAQELSPYPVANHRVAGTVSWRF
jgi:uncharacterized protein (TIGR02001 family)